MTHYQEGDLRRDYRVAPRLQRVLTLPADLQNQVGNFVTIDLGGGSNFEEKKTSKGFIYMRILFKILILYLT